MSNDEMTERFLALYNQEQRGLYSYIRTLLYCRDDAEDVFQETCIALWRSFDRYVPGTNFGAWAREVARHRVLAHGKKRQGDRHRFSDEALNHIATDLQRDADLIERRMAALEECLTKLPADDRDLLQMRYTRKTTTVDLADRIGRPLSTLYKRLTRIRRTLLRCVTLRLDQEEKAI